MLSIFVVLITIFSTVTTEHGPFTKDFVDFLTRHQSHNEYILSSYRTNGNSGTFGGRSNPDDELKNEPVIYVHGNSDSALYHSATATGWTKSVEFFMSNGFTTGELYGITYGNRNISHALQNSVTCRNLVGIRRFVEAVISYTKADKVDIIAHSMGVTLARKAIQGGSVVTTDDSCDLGEDISDKIDTLVAISGANYGMCMCLMDALMNTPACASEGFGPGTCNKKITSMTECGEVEDENECEKKSYSHVINRVNSFNSKEASFIASLWSDDDAILGKNNLVWGKKTSKVPNSDLTHAYKGLDHAQTKDNTAHDQYHLVTSHKRHGGRSARHAN